LGEICELQNGRGFAASEWSPIGLPIIRIQNLNGSLDFNHYAGDLEPEWVVEAGALLFAWAGVRGVSFGPCIWSGPTGVLNQHIYRIVPSPGVNKRWLYETLRITTQNIEKKAHGFKLELVHVRKADITGQVVPFPSSAEQEDIANYAQSLESAHLLAITRTDIVRTLRTSVLNAFF
jgi:type I restriction enzyme S subunit